MSDDINDRPLSPADVRFEIMFALGQAPSGIYAAIRAKSPDGRLRALDQLADRVATRFSHLSVYGPPPQQAPGEPVRNRKGDFDEG